MIEKLKIDMKQIINNINGKNFSSSLLVLSKQLKLIESLFEYEEIKREQILTEEKQVDEANSNVCNVLTLSSEKKHIDGKKMYLFERKIRGGFIPEIEAFVPEGIIRKLGLVHGDLVYAEKVDHFGPNYYSYTVAERIGNDSITNRLQFNCCPVEKDGDLWVVKRSQETDNFIMIDNMPYIALLNRYDVLEHNLNVGDLVDIALLSTDPQTVKVLWKHHIEKLPQIDCESDNKIKISKKRQQNSISEVVKTKTLEGQVILIIGNEPDKSLYKEEIEGRGGEMLWADAKENTQRLRSLVKKSDQVIFLLKVSGHIGMKQLKKFCKQYNKPLEHKWGLAISSILEVVEKHKAQI